jgi:hypothetical protein
LSWGIPELEFVDETAKVGMQKGFTSSDGDVLELDALEGGFVRRSTDCIHMAFSGFGSQLAEGICHRPRF